MTANNAVKSKKSTNFEESTGNGLIKESKCDEKARAFRQVSPKASHHTIRVPGPQQGQEPTESSYSSSSASPAYVLYPCSPDAVAGVWKGERGRRRVRRGFYTFIRRGCVQKIARLNIP